MAMEHKIRIKLKAFDHRVLDKSVWEIVNTAKRTGAVVRGPIPLPTVINKYTVLRSPHIDKKSREHFETNIFTKLIIISFDSKKINNLIKIKFLLLNIINSFIGVFVKIKFNIK